MYVNFGLMVWSGEKGVGSKEGYIESTMRKFHFVL